MIKIFEGSLVFKFITSLRRKFKKVLKKDEYFIFWASLLFYFLLYFNLNNKTLLGLFFIFFFIFFLRLRNSLVVLLILLLLFLPFEKGKDFSFVLIPAWLINTETPYTFSFGITFADLAFIGLLGLIIRDEILSRWKVKRLKLKKGDLFLFGFLLFAFVSLFFSQFQLVSFLVFLRLMRMVIIYFLIQRLLFEPGARKFIPLVLVTSLVFQGGWACLQFIFQRPLGKAIEHITGPFSAYGHVAVEEPSFYRAQGTFDHPNTLGSFLVIFLLFFLVQIFSPKQSEDKRKIFLGSFLVGFLGLVFSASRASWAVFGIMSGFAVLFLKRKGVTPAVLTKRLSKWALLLLVISLPFMILPRLSHLFISLAEHGGVFYRTYLLEKAWLLAQESPLGIGLATFPAALVQKFNFLSWPTPVHNLFLEILVEAGIFSLVFFLLFLVFSYKRFFLNLRRLKSNSEFFLKTGAFFATLGFLGVAEFYPFFWSSNIFVYFWLFLGVMLY